MSIKKFVNVLAGCVGIITVMVGCISCSDNDSGDGYGRFGVSGKTTTAETTTETPKRYNTEEIVVISAIDLENSNITVRRIDDSTEFVLSYNGGTEIKSKYDNYMLMEQMSVGEIVRACYTSGTQKLIELHEYGEAWENTQVVRWDVDYEKKLITIGSSTYSYDDSIFITSNGYGVDIREISGIDYLIVRGVGNKACSVVVNKGHGYVKLTDTVNYVGGIIEIGDRISTVIVEDMVIAAPEGNFTLTASIKGVGGSKDITVIRGQETVVSLGEFEQAVTRYGSVKLNVQPSDAQAILTVDGKEMDYSKLMELSYGEHKMVLTSNNYDTVTKEITISSVYTTINVDMSQQETESTEKPTEDETTSNKENPTEETQTSDGKNPEEPTTSGSSGNAGSSNNVIAITEPTGAKVYFDGAYVGTSPLTFEKVPGEHTIIFKKDGYITKSYTIDVSDDNQDMVLSFPAMLESQ